MEKVFTLTLCWLIAATYSFSQVRSNYEYNTTMPYGTLDIRTHISSSDYTANKSRIAYVAEWTHPRQWDKYSSQKSAAVQLVSGRKYW